MNNNKIEKDKITFSKNLINRLNNDSTSPFYKNINDELNSTFFHYLIHIMDNDDNRDIGFELIIDLYENEDEIYKSILPIFKSYFFIAQDILKINILNVKNLKFLLNNLDKTIDRDLLNNWEINLHNLVIYYQEDLIEESIDLKDKNLVYDKPNLS